MDLGLKSVKKIFLSTKSHQKLDYQRVQVYFTFLLDVIRKHYYFHHHESCTGNNFIEKYIIIEHQT